MPTYREDLHLGHKVTMVETDDIVNRSVTEEKIDDGAVTTRTIKDKSVTNPKLSDGAVDCRVLAMNAVHTRHVLDGSITPCKLSEDVGTKIVKPWIDCLNEAWNEKTEELYNLFKSYSQNGMAVSNIFGDNPYVGVSQKTLTAAFCKIWEKLEDMTGEALQGIQMTVSPKFFISEDKCDVHITANTVEANGIFEHIVFYANGELIAEGENVDTFTYDTSITDTTVIKCVAKIMGIEYERQEVITHYNSFWLGAGSDYTEIMDESHVIPITNGMRGAYDVTCSEGDKLIIIVGHTLRDGFIRADLNSFEIPFTETEVTVDGNDYNVFSSENSYREGTYNIDING